jgi:soluble lytic murein transglycosylase
MRVGLDMSSALLWSGSTIALFAAAVMAQPAAEMLPAPAPAPLQAASVLPASAPAVAAPMPVYDPLRQAIEQWDSLRRDGPASFNDIYRFLVAHPGWPAEAGRPRRRCASARSG